MPQPEKPPLTREERRARRQERRDKQRLANPARAAKMHAARLEAGRELRRGLQESRAEDGPVLPAGQSFARSDSFLDVEETENAGDVIARRFNVGCSGWFYWQWRGLFYPESLATSQWFSYYASKFSTVELNAPFYAWPTVAAVQSWLRAVGRKKFTYTVKVCELITHIKRFNGTARLIEDFYFIGDLLGKHMGCFLFQLPPSFHYSPARLKRVVDQLDPNRRNVVEFRHASWWNPLVFKAFEKSKIIFCSLSAPRLPDVFVQTHDEIYLRLHGLKQWYRHDYSREELKFWSDRIRSANPTRVWAYFDNDNQAHSTRNSKTFLRQLSKR
ncbi:MAG TPA: DUF72 domain-containing protein [Tepidisphaeraceae bacterium]|jgi:uncharacterized protein YecE (DUF72 family)